MYAVKPYAVVKLMVTSGLPLSTSWSTKVEDVLNVVGHLSKRRRNASNVLTLDRIFDSFGGMVNLKVQHQDVYVVAILTATNGQSE